MHRRVQLGFVLLVLVGCTTEDVAVTETDSALDTRIRDGYTEINRARFAVASSSGPLSGQPAWFINDGRRGAPWDPSALANAYWASSHSATVYNCNYENWWVSTRFSAPPGTVCPAGACAHSISEIDLFSLQNDFWTGADPTTSTVTSSWGNVDHVLQYCPEGTTCYPDGLGWVTPPGGYITFNNKAWTKVSFAPVRATAVRAWLHCAQSTTAYAVELEAWERLDPPCTAAFVGPRDHHLPYVGEDNSTATILADSDRFWWKEFGDIDEAAWINASMASANPEWWRIGRRAQALVQMYDLLAPIDFPRAMMYLERLRVLSNALLSNRDDKRTTVPPGAPFPPYDPFHGQVMPAWGKVEPIMDGRWTTQAVIAGMFSYAMAAFARRVAEEPDRFCIGYRLDAIKFTTAVLETYIAFRQDMNLGDPYGYYFRPTSYAGLQCSTGNAKNREDCRSERAAAGFALPWNMSLSMVRAMAEVARAGDSELYRSSSTTWVTEMLINYATHEGPRMIAKHVKYWADHVQHVIWDEPDWAWWYRHPPQYGAVFSNRPDDLPHAGFTLDSLISIWDNRGAIDGLLARYGYPERVALTSLIFTRLATGFVEKIWRSGNRLTFYVDGSGTVSYANNKECGGFIALAQFDRWAWRRCKDAIYTPWVFPQPNLTEGNYAALLRYREYWSMP